MVAQTAVQRKTLNPVFNEAFVLEYPFGLTELAVTVFDWDPPAERQEIGVYMGIYRYIDI